MNEMRLGKISGAAARRVLKREREGKLKVFQIISVLNFGPTFKSSCFEYSLSCSFVRVYMCV